MRGKCKLCLSEADLQDSHLLPKAAYRLIQKSDGDPPVIMKSAVSMHTNEQLRDYVLCRDCEQRLNHDGENWVMEHCYRNSDGFKLKELVESTKPLFENKLTVYSAATVPKIDFDKLAYFATSVLWRASVHDWKSGKDKVRRLYLGKYTEELRRYLLGETGFPPNIVIWVSIVPEQKLWSAATPPYGDRMNECWEYRLPFLGIFFTIFLGARIDPVIRQMCSIRSTQKFIFSGEPATEMVIRDFGGLIAKSRPVGALARFVAS
jgi:hypothetical protein